MFWGASTSPNGTKCSTRLRGTSAGEVNEFSPYSVCLTLGYSLLMPCASSGHIGFTPKRKKHFACCRIIHYRNHLQLNYLLLCGDVHPNPGYENAVTSDINSRVRRKPPTWKYLRLPAQQALDRRIGEPPLENIFAWILDLKQDFNGFPDPYEPSSTLRETSVDFLFIHMYIL